MRNLKYVMSKTEVPKLYKARVICFPRGAKGNYNNL